MLERYSSFQRHGRYFFAGNDPLGRVDGIGLVDEKSCCDKDKSVDPCALHRAKFGWPNDETETLSYTICYKGGKEKCPGQNYGEIADEGIRSCIDKHEQVHIGDTNVTCDASCVVDQPGPKNKTREQKRQIECPAWKTTCECLDVWAEAAAKNVPLPSDRAIGQYRQLKEQCKKAKKNCGSLWADLPPSGTQLQ